MANQDVTRIASNIGALNSLWALSTVNKKLGVAQSRLSTGKRINSAADDPAGLTIATKLNSRSQGLQVALSNIGDAKNLLAVAEAGVGRITDILVQMKNKASQAASDTMGTSEREAIKEQLVAYVGQIDDIVAQTAWNGNKLIDGSYLNTALSFQTGADAADVTNVNGLANLAATTGAGNLGLATKTSTATATIGQNIGGMLSSVDTYATINANLSQLGTGTYTVRVTVNSGTGTDDKIELLDSAGNVLNIAQTVTDGTGTVAKSVMADLSAGGTINFGNGLTATFSNLTAEGTATSTISYAATGTYDVMSGGNTGSALGSAASYRELMTTLEGKLDIVNSVMAKIGAFTGRLEFKEDQVSAAQINVEASYNRIMNANMAEEQVNSSKFQILQQTAIAMLAQANQAPASLLTLFQ
ncbi:flagellin [Leptolinea sp. HRD-7]|nr:flagellin [Leptolinea sp. HRD-7]